jgi:hypothetical protein
MLRVTKITKTTAVASMLAAVAITAPSASARPIDYVPAADSSYTREAGTSNSRASNTRVEVPSSAFDWGDAALGAAGTLSVLGLATGAVVIGRRRGQTTPSAIG